MFPKHKISVYKTAGFCSFYQIVFKQGTIFFCGYIHNGFSSKAAMKEHITQCDSVVYSHGFNTFWITVELYSAEQEDKSGFDTHTILLQLVGSKQWWFGAFQEYVDHKKNIARLIHLNRITWLQ